MNLRLGFKITAKMESYSEEEWSVLFFSFSPWICTDCKSTHTRRPHQSVLSPPAESTGLVDGICRGFIFRALPLRCYVTPGKLHDISASSPTPAVGLGYCYYIIVIIILPLFLPLLLQALPQESPSDTKTSLCKSLCAHNSVNRNSNLFSLE